MKKEVVSINMCRTGPFPTSSEETSEEEPPSSDIPFDLEEGDQVWATGLLPEAQFIQATVRDKTLSMFYHSAKIS